MRNEKPSRRKFIWLSLLCATLVLGLAFVFWPSNHESLALDRTMVALMSGDRAKIEDELSVLEKSQHSAGKELVEIALMLNDQLPAESLSRLNDIAVNESFQKHHALLTAAALLDLDRPGEAEKHIQLVRKSDPDNSFALKQWQALQDSGYFIEKRKNRFLSQMKPRVESFCGDCHATPSPSSFPKSKWAKEVSLGFKFYKLFDRHDLEVPDHDNVVDYFRTLAPESLDESLLERNRVVSTAFRKQPNSPLVINPGIAHISWGPLQDGGAPIAIISDMRHGSIHAVDPMHPKSEPQLLGKLANPCRTTKCDLDGDGDADLLVADLGSFYPKDHRRGRVVCLRSDGQGNYESVVLLEQVGRVADVQPGDFDDDGDQDLVVAEFGWRTSGRILYLENESKSSLSFKVREIDPRHGTIHVPVTDLNQDGNLDFVALISQEHEAVVAFIGDGDGAFVARTLFEANDPSYGSSGIELVDLDQDGDLDVLYTNGDSFDSDLMKPYHGVQWLENQGGLKFASHRLLDCYGAYRALPIDFDQDGDLDVVVASALPVNGKSSEETEKTDTMICLINDGHQKFEERVIEKGNCLHATLEVGDFNQDGADDLITAPLNVFNTDEELPMYDVWLNQSNGGDKN